MDILIPVLLLAAFLGFFFWKYPDMMKEIFSSQKPPVEQAKPSAEVARMPQYGQTGYEDIGSINEPLQPPVVKVPRHQIIKHDYYKAMSNGNLWPRWTCKCGASGYEPTSVYQTLEATQEDAREKGRRHVVDATKADEMLAKSNGRFAF